jgi:phage shock protein A
MADVGMAMQRAIDKTENMRARANAMDELEAAGAFDDQLSLTAGQDDIDRQLHQLSSQSAVDDDLARLRAELGQGTPTPQALESGDPATPSQEKPA